MCVPGHRNGALMTGLVPLWGEKAAYFLFLCPRKGTLIKNRISDFSAFRTVRIKACCVSTQCMGFCQSSLS